MGHMSQITSMSESFVDSSGRSPSTETQSDISCLSCRHKKVKCGREKPRCIRCVKGDKSCEYPDGPMKPGPKAGTGYKLHKRQRLEQRQTIAHSRENSSDTSTQWKRVSGQPTALPSWNGPEATSIQPNHSAIHLERTRSTATSGIGLASGIDMQHPLKSSHINTMAVGAIPDFMEAPSIIPGQSAQLLHQACMTLRTPYQDVIAMIDKYFDNMCAFSLFHRPGFHDKMCGISTPASLHALLAAILTYASHFRQDVIPEQTLPTASLKPTTDEYHHMALKYTDEALNDCGDGVPPIEVLQAMTLTALHQCIRGFRGLAWRTIGQTVRLALELRLHRVDTKTSVSEAIQQPPELWCAKEEQRRLWWAVWELDIFSSSLRKLPTGVDISQAETLLPSDDEHWFANVPQRSCFLAVDPSERWRALKANNVRSPKAWFMVANSYMRNAMQLAEGQPEMPEHGLANGTSQSGQPSWEDFAIIEDAVYCFCLELPEDLKYRGERLNFINESPNAFMRKQQCNVYAVHMMIQLIRLSLYRRKAPPKLSPTSSASVSETSDSALAQQWVQFTSAIDEVLNIIRRTDPDHIKYVNPLLSNIVWVSASLLMVYRRLGLGKGIRSRRLVQSNIDVLKSTYFRFCEYWNMVPYLPNKLRQLEEGLGQYREDIDHATEGAANRPAETSTFDAQSISMDNPLMSNGQQMTYSQPVADSQMASKPGTEVDANTSSMPLDTNDWGADLSFMPMTEMLDLNSGGFFDSPDVGFHQDLQSFLEEIFTANNGY